ncbi:MAG: hypothetical protein ABL933_17150 [Methyloglobulus sp.]
METHFYLSLGQAAKETGKSKSVISKALASGAMSYIEKSTAGYKIDPAELFRVFPRTLENGKKERLETQKDDIENTYLSRENELLRQQLDDLKEDRDRWRQQATALLTHQPAQPDPPPQKSGLLARLWRGKPPQ